MSTDWARDQISSHLRVAKDVGAWWSAVLPLALERSIPMFAIASMPASIVDRPQPLLAIARGILAGIDRSTRGANVTFEPDRGWVDDATVAAVALEVFQAISVLAKEYDTSVAAELLSWLLRNEVAWAAREEHWALWLQLQDVAMGRHELGSGATRRRILDIVSAQIGPEFKAELERAKEAASRIPISAAEHEFLTYGMALEDAADREAGIIISLDLAARREAALKVERQLIDALGTESWFRIRNAPPIEAPDR